MILINYSFISTSYSTFPSTPYILLLFLLFSPFFPLSICQFPSSTFLTYLFYLLPLSVRSLSFHLFLSTPFPFSHLHLFTYFIFLLDYIHVLTSIFSPSVIFIYCLKIEQFQNSFYFLFPFLVLHIFASRLSLNLRGSLFRSPEFESSKEE